MWNRTIGTGFLTCFLCLTCGRILWSTLVAWAPAIAIQSYQSQSRNNVPVRPIEPYRDRVRSIIGGHHIKAEDHLGVYSIVYKHFTTTDSCLPAITSSSLPVIYFQLPRILASIRLSLSPFHLTRYGRIGSPMDGRLTSTFSDAYSLCRRLFPRFIVANNLDQQYRIVYIFPGDSYLHHCEQHI